MESHTALDPITSSDGDDRFPSDLSSVSGASWEDIGESESSTDLESTSEHIHITDWSDRYKIDRPVDLLPTYVVQNGLDTYTGYNAVVSRDNGITYYIGKRYKPVQNKDINTFLEKLSDDLELTFGGATYEEGRTTWKFLLPKVGASFKINGRELSTTFALTVSNSYTGGSSLSVRAGGIIHYCQNAFGLPTKRKAGGIGVEYRARHSESVMALLDEASENIPKMTELYLKAHENTKWNVKPEAIILNELIDLFPSNKDGILNPAVVGLKLARAKENWGTDDFNWYMALTNATTYPERYGLTPTAVEKVRHYHDESFLTCV